MGRSDFPVLLRIPIHWGDMDALGHVNNARYFTYFESARFAYFREIHIGPLREAPDQGPVLASTRCDFRRQLHYPAEIDIGARVARIGTTSFTMEYAIFDHGTGDLVANGEGVLVWVDYDEGVPIPVPDAVRIRIQEIEDRRPPGTT